MRGFTLGFIAAIAFTACVAPTTQLGSVSPEVVAAEQLKQQQLVIRSDLEEARGEEPDCMRFCVIPARSSPSD